MKPYIKGLYTKLELLKKQISNYQNKCQHKNTEHEHGANTGNWDPSNNIYWTTYHCLDCNKRWTEYQ